MAGYHLGLPPEFGEACKHQSEMFAARGRDPVAGRKIKTWADNNNISFTPETPLRHKLQRRFFMPIMRYAFQTT